MSVTVLESGGEESKENDESSENEYFKRGASVKFRNSKSMAADPPKRERMTSLTLSRSKSFSDIAIESVTETAKSLKPSPQSFGIVALLIPMGLVIFAIRYRHWVVFKDGVVESKEK
jgi:hypothetical protein